MVSTNIVVSITDGCMLNNTIHDHCNLHAIVLVSGTLTRRRIEGLGTTSFVPSLPPKIYLQHGKEKAAEWSWE